MQNKKCSIGGRASRELPRSGHPQNRGRGPAPSRFLRVADAVVEPSPPLPGASRAMPPSRFFRSHFVVRLAIQSGVNAVSLLPLNSNRTQRGGYTGRLTRQAVQNRYGANPRLGGIQHRDQGGGWRREGWRTLELTNWKGFVGRRLRITRNRAGVRKLQLVLA